MIEGLAAVILSLNEEKRIGRCVESLFPLAQTLIVFDSGSTDATLDIVAKTWKQAGRRQSDLWIISQKWRGFLKTRNESLDWAQSHKWILWLDSDEWISSELSQELKDFFSQLKQREPLCVKIPRLSFYRGRAIRHSGWFPDKKYRLGRSGKVVWRGGPDGAQVHEDLFPTTGERDNLSLEFKGFIYHEPFLTLEEHRDTNKRYALLLAEAKFNQMERQGKIALPGRAYIQIKACIKFIENFIFKFGFLDGISGLVICWESARGMKMRLERLRELVERAQSPS